MHAPRQPAANFMKLMFLPFLFDDLCHLVCIAVRW